MKDTGLNKYELQRFVRKWMPPEDYHKCEAHLVECELCKNAVDGARNIDDWPKFYRDMDVTTGRVMRKT